MSHAEATRTLLLGSYPRGTFLIRYSELGSTGFMLSVRDNDHSVQQIEHYRIHVHGSKYFIARANTFASIEALITHYSNDANGLCCRLADPCLKAMPSNWLGFGDEVNWRDLEIVNKLRDGRYSEMYLGIFRDTEKIAVKRLKTGTMVSAMS